MTAKKSADRIAEGLARQGVRRRAVGEKRYLKSDLEFLGVALPKLRSAAREWLRAHPRLPRRRLLALVRELWSRGVHELRMVAIELLRASGPCAAAELPLLERLLREARSWAYVDAIAVHLVGPLVEADASAGEALDRWAADEDFWIRRSAMLALLLPLRRGEGDWRRFSRYADAMVEEREFFIRKAIGWVLRERAKTHPRQVARWLGARIPRISGVTIREAVKYLEDRERERLMHRYRTR